VLLSLSDEQVREAYGKLPYIRIDDSSEVKLNRFWVQENMSMVHIPQLKGKHTYGGKSSGRVYCNKAIHQQLKDAFDEIEEHGLVRDIVFWGGSFVPRMVRGSDTRVSRHSYGIAFDINPRHNKLGQAVADTHESGTVLRLVPIFERHGFAWGGNFPRTDGMHFECTGETDKEGERHDAS
jgi:hypothetical protein